jgi:hypothetical protein
LQCQKAEDELVLPHERLVRLVSYHREHTDAVPDMVAQWPDRRLRPTTALHWRITVAKRRIRT